MKKGKSNLVFIVIIFVLFTGLAYRGISSPAVSFNSTETTLTLTGPKETSVQLDYADIISAELVTEPDYGTAAGGGTTGKLLYGIWENELWGSYQAFVSSKIPCCIVLSTADGITVFNLENQDTTQRLYTSLLEFGNLESTENVSQAETRLTFSVRMYKSHPYPYQANLSSSHCAI